MMQIRGLEEVKAVKVKAKGTYVERVNPKRKICRHQGKPRVRPM